MERKITSGMMLTLLVISMLTLAVNIQSVKAAGVHALWPMLFHDARHTSRSKYVGPQANETCWTYIFDSLQDLSHASSRQPIVGPDGVIYFGLRLEDGTGIIYAINPNGTTKWTFDLDVIPGTPTIGPDDTIYVGCYPNTTYVLDSRDGSLKQTFLVGGQSIIGPDGTLYIASWEKKQLFAFNPDGTEKWMFPSSPPDMGTIQVPAIGLDGTVFISYQGGIALQDMRYGALIALNPENGTARWSQVLWPYVSSPSIGPEGTVYVYNIQHLYAFDPNTGSILWATYAPESEYAPLGSPAISSDGTIIVAGYGGIFGTRLIVRAFTPSGDVLWNFTLPQEGGLYYRSMTPVIDSNGNIFVGTSVGERRYDITFNRGILLHSLDKEGKINWSYHFPEPWQSPSLPSIGPNESLYVVVSRTIWPNPPETVLFAFGPEPTPPNQPPSADFTCTPHNPIIGEEITFDASNSYDPDGGTIANYRWEFYRITEYVPFPLIGMKEGADKKTVNYTFYSKGTYIVNLTVTDDEGETDSIDETVRVWEKWSFAIIADPHIGGLLHGDGYESQDYGSPGWDDDESGTDTHLTTKYLMKTVSNINSHIRFGNEHNIAFVVVLGDLTDSAEMSEFNKAKEILNTLDVPWIPIVGNHDIWPYSTGSERYSGNTPDLFFHNTFEDQYEKLATDIFSGSWNKASTPVQDPNGKQYYLQNFAFDYKGYHFVSLDFNSRNLMFPPPLVPSAEKAGVQPWACLYDFEDGTWDWFKNHIDAYQNKGDENIIVFSHHPMWDLIPGLAFWWWDMAEIELYINTNSLRNTLWGNFAGHTHRNADYYDLLMGMYIIETDANFRAPLAKIVQIYCNGTIDYFTSLPESVEWLRVAAYSPVDLVVTDPDGFLISKELNEVPEALYVEDDFNEDGSLDDLIAICKRKTGDYSITVVPEADAEITDTYTLVVSGEDATVVLAENVPIGNIPSQPYILNPTALDIPPTTLLDIGNPKFRVNDITYLTSATPITLMAEDNPGGSGVASRAYRFYNATHDSGWIAYAQPFYLNGLSDGTYQIDYNSTDNVGNIELTNTVTIILDNAPPSTLLTVGEPKYVTGMTFVTSETPFTLEANDNVGSGVYSIAYRIYNSSYDSGWLLYTTPFYLTALADAVYTIEFNSTDNVGNVEPSNTAFVVLDDTGPSVAVENPPVGWALQDGVTFIISANDAGSGVSSVNFSIREANGGGGTPVGFEDLPAIYNATTGKWTIFFDTLLLPDGYYVVVVEATDNLGNISSVIVPYSIRNWTVLELLPASENNKAGRTMPVKFALRVAAVVDPNQPFVYNEDLTIQIYCIDDPSNILQTSTFGDTARDYRVDSTKELYITNFQTLKTPTQYTVSVYRNIFLIDSFDFQTGK